MTYRLTIIPRASKDLEALETRLFGQVTRAIRSLAKHPRSSASIKLSDEEGGYRIRVRDIRVLYRINDRDKEVVVYRIKHRREVYRE